MNELQAFKSGSAVTLYAVLLDAARQIWDGAAFVALPNLSSWAAAAVPLANYQGNIYLGDLPEYAIEAKTYIVYEQAGIEPDASDRIRGVGSLAQIPVIDLQPILDVLAAGVSIADESKTGFKLAADGLDAIPITPPTGAIETFTHLFVNLWSKFATRTALSALRVQLLPREVHVSDIGVRIVVRILDGTEPMDLRSVTKKELHFKPPTGAKKTKTAIFSTDGSDGLIEYVTVLGDLSEVGNWQVQAYIELGTAKLHSNLVTFTVHTNL